MPRKLWLIWVLACSLLLSACIGVSTATQAVQPCHIGAWELTTESGAAFFNATIPQGSLEPGSYKYLGGGGSVIYAFRENGALLIQASPIQVRYSVHSGADLYDLMIQMQGTVKASYKLAGDLIETGAVENSDILYVAKMGADEMMNTQKPEDFVPLLVKPYTKGRITCTPDKLTLEILNQPGVSSPIEFTRIVLPTPTP